MSREFGSYGGNGFFHQKIEDAAADASGGRWAPTKMMEPVLRALYDAAWQCSSVEECDSGPGADTQGRWLEAMARARQELDLAIALAEGTVFE